MLSSVPLPHRYPMCGPNTFYFFTVFGSFCFCLLAPLSQLCAEIWPLVKHIEGRVQRQINKTHSEDQKQIRPVRKTRDLHVTIYVGLILLGRQMSSKNVNKDKDKSKGCMLGRLSSNFSREFTWYSLTLDNQYGTEE